MCSPHTESAAALLHEEWMSLSRVSEYPEMVANQYWLGVDEVHDWAVVRSCPRRRLQSGPRAVSLVFNWKAFQIQHSAFGLPVESGA
jgi:hypothetical protein